MSVRPPLLLANARLVDPQSGREGAGALMVQHGAIAALAWGENPDPPENAQRIDCRGATLAPGIVDMRVFIGEPGARHNESFRSGGRAAAAGGVTCIATQPDTLPPIDDPAMVAFLLRRAHDSCSIRIAPMAALTVGLKGERMTEYQFLRDAGAVAFTDADRPLSDAAVMRRCMDYATSLDALVVHHPQEPRLTGAAGATESAHAAWMGIRGAPRLAETIMLERDLRLVEMTGARYHADQISVQSALAPLRRAKEAGLPVSAAVSVPHFSLNAFDITGYRTFCKIAPPLRPEEDRAAIAEAVAEGLIDCIVSSHRPQDEESKRLPFEMAANGAVGLETLLPVSLALARETGMGLPTLFTRLSLAPARLLGVDGGRLAPGAPADLVLFDPDAPWRLDRHRLKSKAGNSPFDDALLMGKVLRCFVGGECIFSQETSRAPEARLASAERDREP